MNDSIQRLGAALVVCGLLLAAGPVAWAFDQWGDNGSTPVGGGGNPGPGGGPPPNDPGPHDSEPVAIYSGQYTLDAFDLFIPGRVPLRIHRLYRSGSPFQGMFGRGWNCDYNERVLVLATNGDLTIRRDNTDLEHFSNLGNNLFAPAGSHDTITHNGDGTYTVRDKFGNLKQYNVNGCLVEIRDRNFNQLLLSYDPGGKEPINAVSDFSHFTNSILIARDFRLTRVEVAFNYSLSGRYLAFAYNPSGRVTNVTDFSGRSWTYQYDSGGLGELVSVTTPPAAGYPSGLTTTYAYTGTNGHYMQSLIDQSGNSVATNYYDSLGRVVQQSWGSATWSFGYPTATNRWLTNGNGFVIQRIFNTNGVMLERRDYTAGLRPSDPTYYSTQYGYDTNGLLSKTLYAAGNVETSTYDGLGNQIESRRKASATTNSPQDLVTTFTYEPRFNQVKTVTDPRGNVITNVYDYEDPSSGGTNGNLIRTIYPAINGSNPVVTYSYNAFGAITSTTNQLGIVTVYVHDPGSGFALQRIDAFGTVYAATNNFTYDAHGNVLSATDPLGNTTTNLYDTLDRLIQVTGPAPYYYLTTYSYTGNGHPAQIQRQTGNVAHPWQTNTFTYDALDRLHTVADDAGHVTTLVYDRNGNMAQTIDANSNTITTVYDERNLPWKIIDVLSNTVTQSYTLNGGVATWQDPRGNTINFGYDAYNRLAAVTNADGTFELMVYDPTGNVTARRKRNGHWTTNSFDALNQLRTKNYADGTTLQLTLDAGGRLTQVVDSNGVTSFVYDPLGHIVSSTNAYGNVLQFAFTPAGYLARLTYPDSTFVTYTYDTLNRATNISYNGGTIAALTYDALSRRTRADFGNATYATYAYDNANRLTNLVHSPPGGGSPLARFDYTFDGAGNRLTTTTTGTLVPGQSVFQYDSTYQVTNAQYPVSSPFANETLSYDATANRTLLNSGGSTTYTVNNRNQYTGIGARALTYTPDGGLISDGVWTYGYDEDDRLVSAAGQGITASYIYDSFGRRIHKTVNGTGRQFLYNDVGDIPVLIGENDALGNPQVKYIYYGISALAMVVSNNIYTLHSDHFERPVLATDAGGAIAWQAAYSAFGETVLASTNRVTQPLRSPGLYADSESTLQYNLARFYDPQSGRYISEDPALEAGSPLFSQVQDKNAYAYVRNNPVNEVDPNGQSVLLFCSLGLPVCSAAIFCSLNVGACSAGLVCSANVGACSLAVACSGQAGGASVCSGGVVCSAQEVTAGACSFSIRCSGQVNTASACSASVGGCSAQFTPGVDACSANAAGVCSVQVGAYGAGACSLQVAGVCSGQAGVAGVSICSAQTVGACSGQASVVGGGVCSASGAGPCSAQAGVVGYSGCSVQGAGACSAQIGLGRSDCSAQGAGACSVSLGGPYGGCSHQGAGACSVAGPWNGTCSASGGSCSATFGSGQSCDKHASIDRLDPNSPLREFAADDPIRIAGLSLEESSPTSCRLRLEAYGCGKVVLSCRTSIGSAQYRETFSADIANGKLLSVEVPAPAGAATEYKLKLVSRAGGETTLGPLLALRRSAGPAALPVARTKTAPAHNSLSSLASPERVHADGPQQLAAN